MSTAKSDSELLLREAMRFAELMLAKHGEFFPFACAMGPTRQVIAVGGYDGRERPPSSDIINLIASGLRRGASGGEYMATALTYDVRVMPPPAGEQVDAIATELEHRDGYAVTVYFPYVLTNGSPAIADPFATEGSRSIFAS